MNIKTYKQIKIRTVVLGRVSLLQYQCPVCNSFHFESHENPYCCIECQNIGEKRHYEIHDNLNYIGISQIVRPNFKRFKKRYHISKYKKMLVLERDNYLCVYCNRKVGFGILTYEIDHFDPYNYNQNNNLDNLLTSCTKCNRHKYGQIFDTIEQAQDFLYKYYGKYKKYTMVERFKNNGEKNALEAL